MEDMSERFGMKGYDQSAVGPELSLNQPKEKMLEDEDKKRYQSITGDVMYLGEVSCYDIIFAENQLARAMFNPSKTHMEATKHLLRYLVGSVNFSITYKRGEFKFAAYSDENWANNPNNG